MRATRAPLVSVLMAASLPLLGSVALAAPGDPQGPGQGPPAAPGDPAPEEPAPTDEKPDKPQKPAPDTKAPAKPTFGEPTIEPEGVVKLPITGEQGAQLIVKEAGSLVDDARATGKPKILTWTTDHGVHTYTVTATDKAGNQSRPATIEVDVDARAPKIDLFTLKAGTAQDTRSRVSFTTEPQASYRLLVDGTLVTEGTTEGRPVKQVLDLADGRHSIELELADEVGNERTTEKVLKVNIGALDVTAEVVSEVTDLQQVVEVSATPTALSGVLRVPGQGTREFDMTEGAGTAELRLNDGTYDNARVTVRDTHGRTGIVELPEFTVDITPPTLEVETDLAAADDGMLEFTVTTDEDAVVQWELIDVNGDEAASGEFVAQGGTQPVTRDVEEGTYRLDVSATDIFDRTTDQRTSTTIGADAIPLAWVAAAIGGAGLLLLVILLLLVRAWRRRAPARRQRREERQLAGRGRSVRREQLAAYREAERQWRTRYETLATLLQVADQGVQGLYAVLPSLELLPDEKVLFTTTALLVEQEGETLEAVDQGELVVTNLRFAFVGEQQRDWWGSLIDRLRHDGEDLTLVKLQDSEEWSGFSYTDPEATRLYLDLAMAELHGEGAAYVASVSRGLQELELRRPTPPSRH